MERKATGKRGATAKLPLDARAPAAGEVESASLGLGCFWGPDALFGARPGVVRTLVGYAGGEKRRPTYHDLGRHVETVRVEFDPELTSYGEILDLFWRSHDPTARPHKRQYASVIFFESEAQRRTAEASLADRANELGREVVTEVAPLERLWPAEAYHQKFHLRQREELVAEFRRRGYSGREFVDSTVAARLNGFVAGRASPALLERELESYGLTGDSKELLRRIVNS